MYEYDLLCDTVHCMCFAFPISRSPGAVANLNQNDDSRSTSGVVELASDSMATLQRSGTSWALGLSDCAWFCLREWNHAYLERERDRRSLTVTAVVPRADCAALGDLRIGNMVCVVQAVRRGLL